MTGLSLKELRPFIEPFANSMVARYGHPVYVVGSAIDAPNLYDLRDLDIVCVLPDTEFYQRFGCHWTEAQAPMGTDGQRRWATEVGKLSRQFGLNNINLDFKVQCVEWAYWRHKDKPRVRVDGCDVPEVLS